MKQTAEAGEAAADASRGERRGLRLNLVWERRKRGKPSAGAAVAMPEMFLDGSPATEEAGADAGAACSRIALVAPSLEIIGGQGVQAHELAKRLRDEGYAVTFIRIDPPFPQGLRWVRRFPYVRTLLNQALYIPSLLALRHADVAHVFSAAYWSFLLAPVPAMLAGRLFGRRVVLHYHSGEASDHLSRWGILVHPWLRLADEIVVPSRYLQRVFAHHGHRTRVIRNVLETGHFRYRERVPLGPRLLSVRNFEPHYRVDVTLEAFVLLRARYPQATLTFAGSGSEEGRLRRLAASRGGAGIRFIGPVDPLAMPGLYDEADIFVNSSVVDNQPVSVLEAFVAGLPVVSTGTGDIPAMLRDGKTGHLVPHEDPAAMAEAVAALLEDPEDALLMTRRARAEVDRYTWPHVCTAWAEVYARRKG